MPAEIGQLNSLQTLPLFIVGKESRCGGIGELHGLNDLRGDLHIRNLENVTDAIDAKKANLMYKKNIESLHLSWSQYELYDGDASKIENIEEVLKGLQPHPNLKSLSIDNCSGVHFSKWLMDCSFENLVNISLRNCRRCELLPPLGQLPSLIDLNLYAMDAVKYPLDREVYRSRSSKRFPSLKTLCLSNMPNLEELSEMNGEDLLPCLEILNVTKCHKLISLPSLSSIRDLSLEESNTMILRSVASLTSLSSLVIESFLELEFLPEGLLQNHTLLQSLGIINCPKLSSLSRELDNLVALKILEISKCHSLVSFPNEGIQHLTSLRELTIEGLPKLLSLPECLQHLRSLEILTIDSCDKLASLPECLGNLASLRTLQLFLLPCVTSLPTGLQHLSALQELVICQCPHLERRCDRNTGEDRQ